MPLIHPRAFLPPLIPGGLPLGASVSDPFTGVVAAQIKDGSSNIHGLAGAPSFARVHSYDPSHSSSGSWEECWVIMDQKTWSDAIHNGQCQVEWTGAGATAWSVLKAWYKAHQPTPLGTWTWFKVTFDYGTPASAGSTIGSGPWAELRYGSTVVGYRSHRHPNGAGTPQLEEHWFLSSDFTTPANGTPFDIVKMTGSKSGAELASMVDAIGAGNGEYVYVGITQPANFT